MKLRWINRLILSLFFAVPSLFGTAIIKLYNNTVYSMNAQLTFCTSRNQTRTHNQTINPHSSITVRSPKYKRTTTGGGGSDVCPLDSIRVTIPGGQSTVGVLTVQRKEASVLLNVDKKRWNQNEDASFVATANRTQRVMPNNELIIDNLAVYRFIQ